MTTLAAPLLPGLPGALDLNQPVVRREALKPATWQRLQARHRLRGQALRRPCDITRYQAAEDQSDFLLYLYAQVRALGEHAAQWGQAGLSPSRFVTAYGGVETLVCHEQAADWRRGEGLAMLLWLDDVVPSLKARLHFLLLPAWRHPLVSGQLGRMLLAYLFEQCGYQMVEGRTPATNTLALRYIQRLGFQLLATLPHAEWVWAADGTCTEGSVVQSMLTIEQWEKR